MVYGTQITIVFMGFLLTNVHITGGPHIVVNRLISMYTELKMILFPDSQLAGRLMMGSYGDLTKGAFHWKTIGKP